MKKVVCIILAALLVCAALPVFAEGDKPYAGETITVFNWYEYIDPAVIDQFEEETGITVNYAMFTTNEEMYAQLEHSSGAYDVIFPSDYIIERLIKEDALEPLNYDNIPNAAGVIEWMKTPAYDPESTYSVPYMWGTLGLIYNTDLVSEPITSWESIFSGEYKGNVLMMDSVRDTLATALSYLGYSINTRDEDELEEAEDLLIKQKQDGIVAGYFVDETKDKMVAGEAAIALIYSGDALYSLEKADNLVYVVPEEGSNVWLDAMCIPKGSKHKEAAECFINFLCREDIARANMDFIYYSTPIQAVVDGMDEEELANETLNPPQDVVDRCTFFNDVSEDGELYEDIWLDIRMAH